MAALVLAAAAGLGVLLSPAIQTRALARQLEQIGGHSHVDRVAVGLNTTELRGLHWERAGAVLDLPAVNAEFPPVAAVLSKRWLVGAVVAKGWTLDLRGVAGAPWGSLLPAGVWAVSPNLRGLLQHLHLPFDFALGAAELEGDVLLPAGSGVPATRVHVSVTGGGLAGGDEGRFIVRTVAQTEGELPVSRLTTDGALTVAMDSPRTFDRIELRLNAAAFGTKFPAGVRLIADASAQRRADGETYAAVLSSETKPLLALMGDISADGHRPTGTWRLNVADEDLSPFLLGRELPNFDLQGEGQLDTDARGAELHVAGLLHGSYDRLQVLHPPLGALGAGALVADFDLTRQGPLWRIDRLSVAAQATAPLFAIRSLQPFGFDVRTGAFQVADVTGDLFRVDLQAVPASWLEIALPGWELRGGPLTGSLAGAARSGALNVRSLGTMGLPGLQLRREGHAWIDPVDAVFSARADFAPAGWQGQLTDVRLTRGRSEVASGAVRLGARRAARALIKADSQWRVALAAAAPQAGLRAGVLEAEISAEWSAGVTAHASVNATGLVRRSGERLPDLRAEAQVDGLKDGRIALHAPITVGASPSGSALLDANVSRPGGPGQEWEGTLTAERLEPAHAALLGALLGAAGPGRLKFFFGTVPWQGMEAGSVSGQARFSAGKTVVDSLSGRLPGEGTFTVSAALERMADGSARLRGAAVAEELDAGRLLRQWGQGAAASDAWDGKLRLEARWEGAGASPAEAAEGLLGSCEVTSKGGHFRLLATAVNPKSPGGNLAMDALRSVAGTLGSVIKRRKAAEFSNPAEAAVYAAHALSDVAYDQLSFRLTREAGGDWWCRDFVLISPEVRLLGKARVANEPTLPPAERPLDGSLELRAAGKLGEALKYLDAVSAAPDDLGYRACPLAITVKGSLHRPDTSELSAALLRLVAAKGADLLNKLLGK